MWHGIHLERYRTPAKSSSNLSYKLLQYCFQQIASAQLGRPLPSRSSGPEVMVPTKLSVAHVPELTRVEARRRKSVPHDQRFRCSSTSVCKENPRSPRRLRVSTNACKTQLLSGPRLSMAFLSFLRLVRQRDRESPTYPSLPRPTVNSSSSPTLSPNIEFNAR
jgi:hypothetical protein